MDDVHSASFSTHQPLLGTVEPPRHSVCAYPRWGIEDADINVSSAESPQLSKVSFFKLCIGQNIALQASSTAREKEI